MGTANTKPRSNFWTWPYTAGFSILMIGVGGMIGMLFGIVILNVILTISGLLIGSLGLGIGLSLIATAPDGYVAKKEMSERRKPSLKEEDLEWTRSGDEIHGSYRDFVIHLKTIPKSGYSDLYVTVRVLQRGRTVATSLAYSHDAAIEKGLSAIRDHLDADLTTDQVFGRLVGKPPMSRGPNAQMSSSARSREAFRRYMA